jgi:hypothetical protein
MYAVLAISAMMTAVLMTNRSAIAAPDMQTITLNTGYDHDNQKAYPVGTPDLFWTIFKDPIPLTTEARAADTIQGHGAWKPPQGTNESQWISYIPGGSKYLKAGAYYYQKCFCLKKTLWDNKEAIAQSSLDVSVRSDDAFYLGLNVPWNLLGPGSTSNHLASGGSAGGFAGLPAVWKIAGNDLVKLLRPGRNCLTVRVDDIGGVITGFNLKGSLTTNGVDGIAKATNSGPQFDRCSSCLATKTDMESDVKSLIDGTLREGSVRPPEK